jgi:hypothetical protein
MLDVIVPYLALSNICIPCMRLNIGTFYFAYSYFWLNLIKRNSRILTKLCGVAVRTLLLLNIYFSIKISWILKVIDKCKVSTPLTKAAEWVRIHQGLLAMKWGIHWPHAGSVHSIFSGPKRVPSSHTVHIAAAWIERGCRTRRRISQNKWMIAGAIS